MILKTTKQFRKDFNRARDRGYDKSLLSEVLEMLLREEKLPDNYRDRALAGNYIGYRECHINPDWLLIYGYSGDRLILIANRTGSHSDLFR